MGKLGDALKRAGKAVRGSIGPGEFEAAQTDYVQPLREWRFRPQHAGGDVFFEWGDDALDLHAMRPRPDIHEAGRSDRAVTGQVRLLGWRDQLFLRKYDGNRCVGH